MRALPVLIILLLSGIVCQAQSPFSKFVQSPSDYELTCKFSYVTRDDIPVKGSGSVWICEDNFSVRTNGLIVLCDGKTRWTIDEEAKEIYAESSDDLRDFLDNPALLLQTMTAIKETSDGITGLYVYENQKIDLKFSSMKLVPVCETKKSFNPESEVKDFKSKGFILTDLR